MVTLTAADCQHVLDTWQYAVGHNAVRGNMTNAVTLTLTLSDPLQQIMQGPLPQLLRPGVHAQPNPLHGLPSAPNVQMQHDAGASLQHTPLQGLSV